MSNKNKFIDNGNGLIINGKRVSDKNKKNNTTDEKSKEKKTKQ